MRKYMMQVAQHEGLLTSWRWCYRRRLKTAGNVGSGKITIRLSLLLERLQCNDMASCLVTTNWCKVLVPTSLMVTMIRVFSPRVSTLLRSQHEPCSTSKPLSLLASVCSNIISWLFNGERSPIWNIIAEALLDFVVYTATTDACQHSCTCTGGWTKWNAGEMQPVSCMPYYYETGDQPAAAAVWTVRAAYRWFDWGWLCCVLPATDMD